MQVMADPFSPLFSIDMARDTAAKLFRMIDRNNSGAVEREEADAMLRLISRIVPPIQTNDQTLRAYEMVLDADNNGKITQSDIEQLVIRYFCGQGTGSFNVIQTQQAPQYSANSFKSFTSQTTTMTSGGQSPLLLPIVTTGAGGVLTPTMAQPAGANFTQSTSGYLSPGGASMTTSKVVTTKKYVQTSEGSNLLAGPPLSPTITNSYVPQGYTQTTTVSPMGGETTTTTTTKTTVIRSSAGGTPTTAGVPGTPGYRARQLLDSLDPQRTGFIPTDAIPEVIKETYKIMNLPFEPSPEDIQSYRNMLDNYGTGRVARNEFEELIIKSLENSS